MWRKENGEEDVGEEGKLLCVEISILCRGSGSIFWIILLVILSAAGIITSVSQPCMRFVNSVWFSWDLYLSQKSSPPSPWCNISQTCLELYLILKTVQIASLSASKWRKLSKLVHEMESNLKHNYSSLFLNDLVILSSALRTSTDSYHCADHRVYKYLTACHIRLK